MGKVDEFTLISYAVAGYFILVILASLFNLQLAVRIIASGTIGIVGFIIFVTSIADLADRRGLRTVDVIVYALLVTLYAVLAGIVVYYWKPWVVLALIGMAGVLEAGCLAGDLLSRLPN
jgi:uncharacterized membrane protein YjjP (DUF1212 family)